MSIKNILDAKLLEAGRTLFISITPNYSITMVTYAENMVMSHKSKWKK